MAENDDNLSPLITQCPNCDARFRVTENQLQVAHGRVRCGACLSVFDATAQLLMDGEQLSASPETDVDALLDELDDSDLEEEAAITAATETSPELISEQNTVTQPTDAVPQPVGHKDADTNQSEPEIPAELLALEAALLDDLKVTGPVRAEAGAVDAVTQSGDDAAQEEWVGELDEVNWTDAHKTAAEAGAAGSGDRDDIDSDIEGIEEQDLEAIEEPPIAVEEVAAVSDDTTSEVAARVVSTAQPRNGFEDLRIPEPPVFEEPERPRRSWMTLALIAVAVVALPAQVLWFQFDSWAKDPRYRPMYGAICSVVGCDLPVMRDLTKLERREFHMRHHPESDNAYIFDLLIVNVADFPQPYPVIELVASTERGSLVAGRRFKPEEYLHGEVRPTDLLQPKTPVHISLEIEHPGHPNLEFQTRFR